MRARAVRVKRSAATLSLGTSRKLRNSTMLVTLVHDFGARTTHRTSSVTVPTTTTVFGFLPFSGSPSFAMRERLRGGPVWKQQPCV
jgi:hypothetical protein